MISINKKTLLLSLIRTTFSVSGVLFIFGCCPYIFDPSDIGDSSLSRGMSWVPSNYARREEFEDIPEVEDPWLPDTEGPVTVVDLLDIALYNNPNTELAWATARAAAFNVGIAESAIYPNFQGATSLNYTNNHFGNNVVSNTIPNNSSLAPTRYAWWEKDLTVTYLLLDFGGRTASIEAARQALFAANWSQNRTLQQVMFNALQAYYLYEGNVESYIAAQADLKTAQTTFDAADALYSAGVGVITDVLQAKANLIKAELNLETANGQVKISHGALIQALGLPHCVKINFTNLPKELPIEKICKNVDVYINMAMERRPDLSAAYANVQQQKSNLILAWSESLPTINANVSLMSENYLTRGIHNGHNYTSSITLNVPLFEGFYYLNTIRNAREQVDIACANLELTELTIVQDVITSYWNFHTAIESVKSSQEYLKYAQEAYDAALASFQYGTGTFVTLIQAQSTLADARYQVALAKTQWFTSLANLSYSTGTLEVPSLKEDDLSAITIPPEAISCDCDKEEECVEED